MATSSQAQATTSSGEARSWTSQARRGLAIFFTVVIPLTALFQPLIALTGRMDWCLSLMWTPTLAALSHS